MSILERIKKNTEEILTPKELERVLQLKKPHAYVGLEPSGLVHIGWIPIIKKVKDLVSCGVEFTVLLADWHAWINEKLRSNLRDIRTCGEYIKDCFSAFGVERLNFVYANDLVGKRYFERVLRIAQQISLARTKRAMSIMGRSEENPDLSKLFYPAMQVADMFELDADIALGGMDQRRAHVLVREVADKLNWKKPAAIHMPIFPSLQGGERMDQKMSKSRPETCIFLHDSNKQVEEKLRKAWCPEKVLLGNPVLSIYKHILFPENDKILVEREEKWGGALELTCAELEQAYSNGELHPLDLKNAAAKKLNQMLRPIRQYFDKHHENLTVMKRIA